MVHGNASHWLNVIPTAADHYDLSTSQFRDALSLRYWHETWLPERLDGCNEVMNVCHALKYNKIGLVKHRLDYVRDNGAEMIKLDFSF